MIAKNESVGRKILDIHTEIRSRNHGLARLGVALYDPETDVLKTFLQSDGGTAALEHYQAKLSDVPSLQLLAKTGESRIIDDLQALSGSNSEHTQRLLAAGYQSSYTTPLLAGDRLLGFLFFDADEPQYFRTEVAVRMNVYARLISAMISSDLAPMKTLKGAVKTAQEFSRFRDEETASHLSRMSHYAQVIAAAIAPQLGLSDEFVEFVYQFAPLHDVGKIAVPDHILLKPGRLDPDEYEVVKGHVTSGLEIADILIKEFELFDIQHIEVMRNIVGGHHERYDGSGYPAGLAAEEIPIEARIVGVADVFDAVTSPRPYKTAWEFTEGVEYLQANSGVLFDPLCVQAFTDNLASIEAIFRCFAETAR